MAGCLQVIPSHLESVLCAISHPSQCSIRYCCTLYTKFCIGFKIRKSRCRTTLTLRFGSFKMIFECSIARCDVGLGRAIVQCQKNPLRKPKLSINRAILSAHFSAVKFCIGFMRTFLLLSCKFAFTVRKNKHREEAKVLETI